ncbi:hypothetical protein CRE_01058 [Caenorhabditis remanei]|uniref:Serpentine receptor class gamma n=1 Tax=Caenorhabditis remanei TaxID=31234 RepID=E3MI95_CAERE|nr:hypothetical protein CRE_01058 [Caenorhabditis remanei]
MIDQKLFILGILLVFAFVLNAIGVFTPCWIVDSFGFTSRIVPYNRYAPLWFLAATVSMYLSFVLYIFMILIYTYSLLIVHRKGYSRSVKKWFSLITNASGMIVCFTVLALILIGVNISKASNSSDSYTLGYSAWLCVASAVISLGIFFNVVFFVHKECK